jgi:phosphoglycolate phosphatase-like HAD superfamily hydrolase
LKVGGELKLAVFDIDGTLTDTNAVDDEEYCAAVAETLGIPVAAINWGSAPHITDEGIFDYVCRTHDRLPIDRALVHAARERLVQGLQQRLRDAPQLFLAVPGAPNAIRKLPASGWHVAYATGCWRASAHLKLVAGRIEYDDAVLACAEDALARADIVRAAVRRAEQRYGATFKRVVSIGDGTWDVAAARELALPFVGIGNAEAAKRLHQRGAKTVLTDFCNFAAVLDALESATRPGSWPRLHGHQRHFRRKLIFITLYVIL